MTDSVPLSKQKLESLESSYTLEVDEVLHQLATPPYLGLSSGEVARRLNEVGPNQLAEAPPHFNLADVVGAIQQLCRLAARRRLAGFGHSGGLARSDCDFCSLSCSTLV